MAKTPSERLIAVLTGLQPPSEALHPVQAPEAQAAGLAKIFLATKGRRQKPPFLPGDFVTYLPQVGMEDSKYRGKIIRIYWSDLHRTDPSHIAMLRSKDQPWSFLPGADCILALFHPAEMELIFEISHTDLLELNTKVG